MIWVSTISISPAIATEKMSLEDAARKGFVKLTIKAKGGHTGDVIDMKITNLTNRVLPLKLEAGRKLDSQKQTEQDILVTQAQDFVLAVGQQKNLSVRGMCCQAHNSSPDKNTPYSIGKMADSTLIKIARFIDSSKYYTSTSAQCAVWCVSDNESLGAIANGSGEEVSPLQKYVSKITGRPIPKYSLTYNGDDNNVLGRVTKIDAMFHYVLDENSKVALAIYDSNGKLIQMVMPDKGHEKGEYKVFYTFKTKDLERGTYYARLTENGSVMKEEEIQF